MNPGIVFLIRTTPRRAIRRVRAMGWFRAALFVLGPVLFFGLLILLNAGRPGSSINRFVTLSTSRMLFSYAPFPLTGLMLLYAFNVGALPLHPWEAERLLVAPVSPHALRLYSFVRLLVSGGAAAIGFIPMVALWNLPIFWNSIALTLVSATVIVQGALVGVVISMIIARGVHTVVAIAGVVTVLLAPGAVEILTAALPLDAALLAAKWPRLIIAPALIPFEIMQAPTLAGRLFWLSASVASLVLAGVAYVFGPTGSAESAIDRTRRTVQLFRAMTTGSSGRSGGRTYATPRQLPRWGGFGPLAWRKMITLRRMPLRLWFGPVAISLATLAPAVVLSKVNLGETGNLIFAASMLVFLLVMVSMAVNFDLRQDWPNVETLRRFPVRPSILVAAEMAPAIVIAWTLSMLLVLGSKYALGLPWWAVGAAAPSALLLLWMFYSAHNLAALMFPAPPSDLPNYGFMIRMMLGLLVGNLLLLVLSLVASAGGAAVWFVTRSAVLVALTVMVLTIAINLAMTWLVALRFQSLDLARGVRL